MLELELELVEMKNKKVVFTVQMNRSLSEFSKCVSCGYDIK